MRSKRYIQYSPWTKMLVSSSILNLKFQKLGLSWMYPPTQDTQDASGNEGLAWDFSSLKIYITIPGWWETNILGREGGEPKGIFSLGTNISIQYQISFSQGTKYWRWSSIPKVGYIIYVTSMEVSKVSNLNCTCAKCLSDWLVSSCAFPLYRRRWCFGPKHKAGPSLYASSSYLGFLQISLGERPRVSLWILKL